MRATQAQPIPLRLLDATSVQRHPGQAGSPARTSARASARKAADTPVHARRSSSDESCRQARVHVFATPGVLPRDTRSAEGWDDEYAEIPTRLTP